MLSKKENSPSNFAHPRYDVRIFAKECVSLKLGYQVCLIVADGLKGRN